MKERTGGRRKCLPLSRKAKYEFQNAKVRRFEVSINNDYSQFKKRKKQPYIKNCRECFRENHQHISPTSATGHFPFTYTTLMCTPQECSICWAACEKYYSTAVVFFFWGGGGGGGVCMLKRLRGVFLLNPV